MFCYRKTEKLQNLGLGGEEDFPRKWHSVETCERTEVTVVLEQGREEETKCVPGRETMNKNSGVRKDIKIRNNCGVGCLQFVGSVGDGMRQW